MVVAGAATVLFGVASVPGADGASPEIESEIRFYAAWYVAAGIVLLKALPRIEQEALLVRVVGGGFFLAGSARALAWATEGRPDDFQIVLMIVELVLPIIIVPWQNKVARSAGN